MRTPPRVSRRSLLRGGLALGAGGALGGCAYWPGEEPEVSTPLPASAKAEVDGDLVYFNWADYLHPDVLSGFEREYGVRVVQTNYDSMEGMYAKLRAGNRYDVVFPIAKWVVRLRQERRIRRIDRDQLTNAEQVFHEGSYYDDPWYDAGSAVSVPFTVYKTGIGWRTDKVDTMTGSWEDLWNPQAAGRIITLDDQDEALAMGALLLGYEVNTAKQSELDEIKRLLVSQKDVLRAFSSDDVNNMARGDAWIHHMWSGDFLYLREGVVDDPTAFDFLAPTEGAPINSDAYCIPADAEHPGTAMLFIDWCLRPDNARLNIEWLYYPMPVRDAAGYFEELSADVPATQVSLADLENDLVFRLLDPDAVRRRTATWTEIKAG